MITTALVYSTNLHSLTEETKMSESNVNEAHEAQKRFDEMYISSSEIADELEVSRASVLQARRSGMLPAPIIVHAIQLYIWERAAVRPYIDAWKLNIQRRRGQLIQGA